MLENILMLLDSTGKILDEGAEIEISDIFDFGSGIFAAILMFLSITAYRNTKVKKLLFVATAFGLFCLRTIIDRLDLFIPEVESQAVEIAASITGFIILSLFFIAIVRKEVHKERPR